MRKDPRPLCLFCYWTHVDPGSNCAKCHTYNPKSEARSTEAGRVTFKRHFSIRPQHPPLFNAPRVSS